MSTKRMTRREFLSTTTRSAAAAGLGPTILVRSGAAEPPVLTVAQWAHFIPAFDEWFDAGFAQAWGERHRARVIVDHVPVDRLHDHARAEIAAQRGHDLFGFLTPVPGYEPYVLPMNETVAECERRFGKLLPLAHQGTYNPRSRAYFAFPDSWVPNVLHYRIDWWGEVGVSPDSWEQIREGARAIRRKFGAPAGFGLAREHDSNMTLRGLLWSFGANEQDATGQVTIDSKATVEAVNLMTAIYKEAMTPEAFLWDASSNNRQIVWGRSSVVQNGISALRSAEALNPGMAAKITLAPPPTGPAVRLGAAHMLHCYAVWKFARQPELARQFLVDLVAAHADVLARSGFHSLPTFSTAVPDLGARLAADRRHPRAYAILGAADRWSACPGHPGYASAASDEVFRTFVIPNMFARAARGEQSAEASARQASAEMRKIFARWKG